MKEALHAEKAWSAGFLVSKRAEKLLQLVELIVRYEGGRICSAQGGGPGPPAVRRELHDCGGSDDVRSVRLYKAAPLELRPELGQRRRG